MVLYVCSQGPVDLLVHLDTIPMKELAQNATYHVRLALALGETSAHYALQAGD